MGLLSTKLMDALLALQGKEPEFACAGADFRMSMSCRDTCSGSCSDSCSGDCEESCAGDCEESCAGGCTYSCYADCEDGEY